MKAKTIERILRKENTESILKTLTAIDPNCSIDGFQLLLLVARQSKDCSVIIQNLIDRGAKTDGISKDDTYPLHGAHLLENCKALIDNGADVNILSRYGCNALHCLCSERNMDVSKTVAYLVTKGCNLNLPDTGGYTPLHYAIMYSTVDLCKFLVQELHADLSILTDGGMTPLHLACAVTNGIRLELVEFFHQMGCDPNAYSKKGITAMHSAILCGHIELIKLLSKFSNLELTIQIPGEYYGKTSVEYAVTKSYSLAYPLVVAGARLVNISEYNRIQLIRSVIKNDPQLLGMVLNNCPIDDKFIMYIFRDACKTNDQNVLASILNHVQDINYAGADGRTLLFIACEEAQNLQREVFRQRVDMIFVTS